MLSALDTAGHIVDFTLRTGHAQVPEVPVAAFFGLAGPALRGTSVS